MTITTRMPARLAAATASLASGRSGSISAGEAEQPQPGELLLGRGRDRPGGDRDHAIPGSGEPLGRFERLAGHIGAEPENRLRRAL